MNYNRATAEVKTVHPRVHKLVKTQFDIFGSFYVQPREL